MKTLFLVVFAVTAQAATIRSLAEATQTCMYRDEQGHGDIATFSQASEHGVEVICPNTIILREPYLTTGYLFNSSTSRAEVAADYGHIFGSAIALSGPMGGTFDTHSDVAASYSDAVIVSGAPAGVLRFTLELTGYSLHRPGSTFAPNRSEFFVNGTTIASMPMPYDHTTTLTTSYDQPFTGGTSIDFMATLSLLSRNKQYDENHIDQYLRIQAIDETGNPLTGATLTFDSGASYGATVQPTIANPEPGTWALMGVGILTLAWRRRYDLCK